MFINEMGHVTSRYDAIYTFKEKYPDCLLTISYNEQTTTKKVLCSKFGDWIIVSIFVEKEILSQQEHFWHKLCVCLLFILYKPKVKLVADFDVDSDFDNKWNCIGKRTLLAMTRTAKKLIGICTAEIDNQLKAFSNWMLTQFKTFSECSA